MTVEQYWMGKNLDLELFGMISTAVRATYKGDRNKAPSFASHLWAAPGIVTAL